MPTDYLSGPPNDGTDWRHYAAYAMVCAARDEWERVEACLKRMHANCGHDSIIMAMVAWVDTALHPNPYGKQVVLKFRCADHDRTDCGHPPDGPSTWAGQFMAARLANDEDTLTSLIMAMPLDGYANGEYVAALLIACNLAIADPRPSVVAVPRPTL